MTTITPIAYSKRVNENYDELVIKLRNAGFAGITEQPGQTEIVFEFCFMTKLTIESLEDIEFDEVSIMFTNCFISDFQLENVVSKNISISFHSCMFSARISAVDLLSVAISNCLLESSVFLLGIQKVDIKYTTENIFPHTWKRFFDARNVKDYMPVLISPQYYHIEDPKYLNITSSRKAKDKRGLYRIPNNTVREYKVGYKLTEEEETALTVKLFIEYTANSLDVQTSLSNLPLYSLSLTGNPNGKISVENTAIGNLYVSNFSPKGDVSFYNINPREGHDEETKISIHTSNLDKVWFDNVYFGDYERLSFYRSKFSNAVFTSCSFPDEYKSYEKFAPFENIHYPENRTVNHHKDQYEIFLQLKKALESTGNYYEAQKLQAISHTALNMVPSIGYGDKFILWINRISNNHGLSIKEPFYWFLILSISFYLFYLWSLGLAFQYTPFDPNLIGYYFSFIDLTHRSDFLIEKNEINGLSLAIDLIHKVIIGFFIYQFVAAFRKYGKK